MAFLIPLLWPNPFEEIPSWKGSQSSYCPGDITWNRYTKDGLTCETCKIADQQHHNDGDQEALPKG